jgi:hypothetical protein
MHAHAWNFAMYVCCSGSDMCAWTSSVILQLISTYDELLELLELLDDELLHEEDLYVYVCVCVCKASGTCFRIHVYMRALMYVCYWERILVSFTCVCMYICIYTHIQIRSTDTYYMYIHACIQMDSIQLPSPTHVWELLFLSFLFRHDMNSCKHIQSTYAHVYTDVYIHRRASRECVNVCMRIIV